MQSVMMDDIDGIWVNDNLIHNRMNFTWYASNSINISIQARNRIMMGDRIRFDTLGLYAATISADRGWLDLSENWIEKKSVLINTALDRAWIDYEKGNLNIKLGRQRINWGQTLIWNPNDLFNNYSFFDFDYPEKPGSDALRIQYYTGMTSSVELAAKINENEKITAATLIRLNKWNYDMQILAGVLDEEDAAIGLGWSGAVKNASFRGEMSYFHPIENIADTSGLFFISLSTDYTFSNSLFLQLEAFYGQMPSNQQVFSYTQYYNAPLSVKNMAFTEYNIFAQMGYPVSPLINTNISAMYFPDLKGYFIGPSIDYSVSNSMDLSLFVQAFSGEFNNTAGISERQNFTMGFLRIRWSY